MHHMRMCLCAVLLALLHAARRVNSVGAVVGAAVFAPRSVDALVQTFASVPTRAPTAPVPSNTCRGGLVLSEPIVSVRSTAAHAVAPSRSVDHSGHTGAGVVGRMVSVVCRVLSVVCRVLSVACCALFVWLSVVCGMVSVACCLWFVVRCLSHGVCCLLHAGLDQRLPTAHIARSLRPVAGSHPDAAASASGDVGGE